MNAKNSVRSFISAVVVICFILSCGGGGGDSNSGGSSGQSGSIVLTASVTSIPADGASSAAIKAVIKDSAGNPVRHYTTVTFTTTLGHFRGGGTTYKMETQPPLDKDGFPDPNAAPTGVAEASLIAGTRAGTALVTVVSNNVSQSILIEITGGLVSGISLKASVGSVSSDNSDNTTITATVLDASNAALKNTTVTFSASDGTLSAPSVVTDENGKADVSFSCGNLDNSNRISTITARSGTVSKQILIQVTGTTLDLKTDYNNLEIDAATDSFLAANNRALLTVTAMDAGSNRIYNAHITLSIDPSSTGSVLLSPTSGYTDARGEFQVEVTAKSKGDVTVRIEGLGTSATQAYSVGIAGEAFTIISPEVDPFNLPKGSSVNIVVRAPSQSRVIFATTCGSWDGGGSAVVTKPVENQRVSAILSSVDACVATVQVYDADNSATTDSLKVNIYPPADAAFRIYLQASSYVVARSSGGVFNSVTVEALVRDETFQIVPDVPVSFSIADSTGGGEFVAPPLAYTKKGSGKAEATFTSGSMSSGARGVTVNAAVVGKPNVKDSISIVIGGTAGSVVIGQSTTIYSINNDTTYRLPMTAQVVDSNGNPVPGARISLQLWPLFYRTGVWVPHNIDNTDCRPEVTNEYGNEDDTFPGTAFYRNLILDPGEDKNGDGQLTPSSSASGAVPAEVVADDTGVANFDIVYPKSSGEWIMAELIGSTLVLGSETRSTTEFVLPILQEDAQVCSLPNSPYNKSEPLLNIAVTATPDKILPDDGVSKSSIRATVTQLGGTVADGTKVSFAIISGIGGLGSAGSSEATAVTTAGQASITYFSGDRPGEVVIRASLVDGTSSEVTVTLTRGAGEVFEIVATPTPDTLSADGGNSQSVIRAVVTDSEGFPVFDNTDITFAIVSGSGAFGAAPPTGKNEVTTKTTAGVTSTIYYSGDIPGTVAMRAKANNGSFFDFSITLEEVIGSMSLTANPGSIPADGASSSAITATIRDTAGQPVPKGTPVVFTTDLGTLSASEVTTPNENGVVTVSLISGTAAGTATVTASATIGTSTVTQSKKVVFTDSQQQTISVTASPHNILGNGTDRSTITATLTATGGPLSGVRVGFSTNDTITVTTLSAASAVTNASGEASVTLTGVGAGSAVVTATYGAKSATVDITVLAP